MHVIAVGVAFSSRTVDCMDDHIELSLSGWAFMILAHCVGTLSHDQ
jgi:hypothetical protein